MKGEDSIVAHLALVMRGWVRVKHVKHMGWTLRLSSAFLLDVKSRRDGTSASQWKKRCSDSANEPWRVESRASSVMDVGAVYCRARSIDGMLDDGDWVMAVGT